MKKLLKNLTLLCLTMLIGFMFHSVDAKAARANGSTSLEVNELSNYPGFYVHTDNNWTVTVDPGSEFITPLNPTGTPGDAIIVLKIDQNPSTSTRYGYVRVNDGNGVVTIYITQQGKKDGYFNILKTPFTNGIANVDFAGKELLFTCESNKKVSVLLDGKTVRLIRSYSNGATGTIYEYGLPVPVNTSTKEITRSLSITVDGENIRGGKYHRFSIKQAAFPSFSAKIDLYRITNRITSNQIQENIYVVDSKYVCGIPFQSVGGSGKSFKSTANISYVPNGQWMEFAIYFKSVSLDWVLLEVVDNGSETKVVSRGKSGSVYTTAPLYGSNNQFFVMPQKVYDYFNGKGRIIYENGKLRASNNPDNAPLPYTTLCTVRSVSKNPTKPSDIVVRYR